MRNARTIIVALAFTLIVFVIATAQDKPWFDMENCAFCKNMTAEPGLMDHITKWEHHNVKNGSVTVTVVDEAYLPAYQKAMMGMEATAKKMQAGEKLPMCGMCEAYGAAMMKGAQVDEVQSGNIFVDLMYSDDPEVISEIHAMTDRTNAEMKKMMETQNTGDMGKTDEPKKTKMETPKKDEKK
jgi:hypothetical protein